MYLDTHSHTSMEQFICDYLGVSSESLYSLLKSAGESAQIEQYFNGDVFDEIIYEYISNHFVKAHEIDHILIYHLSRRLNSAQDIFYSNNLFDLLTTENTMTDFLKTHGIEFCPCNGRLDLIYNGGLVSLKSRDREHVPYLRWRLGHNKEHFDFSFNGFLFKDLLFRNHYALELYDVPEFIGVLSAFLNNVEMRNDYFRRSEYYCFEYCVPINKVLFDKNDKLSITDKIRYLLNRTLHRLYDYYSVSDARYMSDHDNPVLRLADNDTMQDCFYVSREIVTSEMLKRFIV